jgi:UDP-N-acetylmuramate dehydrogenase
LKTGPVDLLNETDTFELSLRENVPLAGLTTLRVGGAARFFFEAASIESLLSGIRWAGERHLPLFILGGGSNIVVSDSGFDGLVIRICIKGIQTRITDDAAMLTAGAGQEWDSVVALCARNDWAGVECLSGIPGSVGATPIQNVGAYGQEISETMTSLTAIDLATCEVVEMSRDECRFGYRASRFKAEDRNRFVITGVTYRLRVGGKPLIRYGELERYLAERGAINPSIAETREAVIAIRRRKAMVIDPTDMNSRSVGSFFVNPVVARDELEEIRRRAALLVADIKNMPAFPLDGDRVKLSAAWLIEHAGFERGHARGGAGISAKHALAIINRSQATASEVVSLAEEIRRGVGERFGVELAPEPVFVGFDA